jgi:hypothetical protein
MRPQGRQPTALVGRLVRLNDRRAVGADRAAMARGIVSFGREGRWQLSFDWLDPLPDEVGGSTLRSMTGNEVPGTPRSGLRTYRCKVCGRTEDLPRPEICHGLHMSEVKDGQHDR